VAASTRLLIIESAERLIAERGVNGVSLREIAAEADQRNTSAVAYHFGAKEALVDAVFEHRMTPVNDRRLALLEELDARRQGRTLRGLVEAFTYPFAENLGEPGRPSWYLRFCVQAAYVEGSAPTNLNRQSWTIGSALVRRRALEVLQEGGIPEALVEDRWDLVGSHIAHALAGRELVTHLAPQRAQTPRDLFLSHLIDTATAIAAAPVSSDTVTALESRRLESRRLA